MKKLAPRVLAFLVALSLSLPPPALALRELSTVEKNPKTLTGLEETLKSGTFPVAVRAENRPLALLATFAGAEELTPAEIQAVLKPRLPLLTGGKGALVFDVDKTLLPSRVRLDGSLVGGKDNPNVEQVELAQKVRNQLLDLLKRGVRVVIISGNSRNIQLERVVEPLRASLGDKFAALQSLTLYANGGATRSTFDSGGNEILDEAYNARFLLPQGIPDFLRESLEKLLVGTRLGLTGPEQTAWTQWYATRKDFPNTTFVAPWLNGEPTALSIVEPGKISGVVSAPYVEVRDGLQLSIGLLPSKLELLPKGHTRDVRSFVISSLEKEIGSSLSISGNPLHFRPAGFASIDITRADKGLALAYEIEQTGIDPHAVIYFGDEFHVKQEGDLLLEGNDQPVLQVPDILPVAVGDNAPSAGLDPSGRLLWGGKGPTGVSQWLATLLGLVQRQQLVQQIEQIIASGGDAGGYLTQDLVGLLNRVAPKPRPVEEFQTMSRLSDDGQQVIPVKPAELREQGITSLTLGDAFRHYRHQAAFDYMDNEQHVAAVLRRLQAIVDLSHPTRKGAVLKDLPSRGEERPTEIQDSAGVWRPQGKRVPLTPAGLAQAEPQLMRLSRLYAELPPQIKRDLWLSVFLHDIAKPINVGDHDRIGADLVPELLDGAQLPVGDLALISGVIRPHTLFGISYLREANRWEVVRKLIEIAQALPDPSQRGYFPTMLLLLTVADVDAIGSKGKLSVERLEYWLQLHDEVQAAIQRGQVSEPDAAALRTFGMERLAVFTDPLPGHRHSKQDLPKALDTVFGADAEGRERFLERLGRVYRFSYAYEPLRAMGDPVGVVRFFQVLLQLVSDDELSGQINFFDDSLGFRRVGRDRIEQVRQLVTDPQLVLDPAGRRVISRGTVLWVEKNPAKPELLVKFEAGVEEQAEKLTWAAWWKTLGSKRNAYNALLKFPRPDRAAFRGKIHGLVNQQVDLGLDPRATLVIGIPLAADVFSQKQFSEALGFLFDLGAQPGFLWGSVGKPQLTQVVEEVLRFQQEGIGYQLRVTPEKGHFEEVFDSEAYGAAHTAAEEAASNSMSGYNASPSPSSYTSRVYFVDKPQRIEPIPLPHSAETQAGLEERLPMRFIVDTSKGDPEVLNFARWAALLVRKGVRVRFAGVATAWELSQIQEQVPEMADLFEDYIRVYKPGDPESYENALSVAKGLVFGDAGKAPSEFVITHADPVMIRWFLGELDRLGISDSTAPGLREEIRSTLTAA